MFDPKNLESAKGWATGHCNGFETDVRWETETPVIAKAIADRAVSLEVEGPHQLLDYGCGPARVTRAVLERLEDEDVFVTCVDDSEDMRKIAQENLSQWMEQGRARVIAPEDLQPMLGKSSSPFVLTYCVYVLQHVKLEDLTRVVNTVHSSSDLLLLVNSVQRLAVTDDGFQNDGRNVLDLIERRYSKFEWALPAEAVVTDPVHRAMYLEGDLRHYALWCWGRIEQVASIRRVILSQDQSPGDVAAFSRAVVDLKETFPSWEIDVRTPCPELFENNQHLTSLSEGDPEVEQFKITYPEVHNSGWSGIHFAEAFHREIENQLDVIIRRSGIRPHIELSETEKGWIHQAKTEFGIDRFWLVNGGYKPDCYLKYYPYWQQVVDILVESGMHVIQIGHHSHEHPVLSGVFNLIGKTDLRQLIRLAYWSDGLMGPISFQMHLAAGLGKPAVVVAGGKEPVRWEMYPNHRYLAVNGCIDCCPWDGCWKSRKEDCAHLLDGEVPLCYEMIRPEQVADAVLSYYGGGLLEWPAEWNLRKEASNAG